MQVSPMTAPADAQKLMIYDANKKSTGVAYLLWFFTGGIGGHRFYMGKTGSAVGMLIITVLSLITLAAVIGAFGLIAIAIWAIVDAFLIPGWVTEHNNRLIASMG